MNNKLAKHYDDLTMGERIALILRSQTRGDEGERIALASSAKKYTYRIADFYPRLDALERLAMGFVLDQLNMGCLLLWSSYLEDEDDSKGNIWPMVERLAAEYLAHAKAWAIFCGEHGISPADLTPGDYPGLDTLAIVDKLAGGIAKPEAIDPNPYLEGLRSTLGELSKAWE